MEPVGSRGASEQPSAIGEGITYSYSPEQVKSSAATGTVGRVHGLGLAPNRFTSESQGP